MFFSNYAHVLICLNSAPESTEREIALKVRITERAVQRIIARLVSAGFVKVTRRGRRNVYQLDLNQNLRHPLVAHKKIGEFLQLVQPKTAMNAG